MMNPNSKTKLPEMPCTPLNRRLQGLLNQAIIAQEDVEGYFVIRRVSFIIAAAVGRQLAARRV
eukprot:jgi/Botrbrau1/6649/Bobra.104_2s0036.1